MKRLLTLLFFAFALAAYSQPTEPILRIETGMHSSLIRRTSTDALGKYILTGSNDRTARLWDAETGKLLNTFRIPIGKANEDKVSSCALSPDGKVAALGGSTGYEWDGKYSIYIVNTQTGKIIYRISDLPGKIRDLKFSPNGIWLAAGLSGNNGVRVFKSQDWSEFTSITGFNDDVECLAFDNKNQLAAASTDDHKLQLFDSKFKLKVETVLPKGPMSISFNNNGDLLAIGFNDGSPVEVRNAQDLSLLFNPVNTGIGCIGAVFNNDSKKLYGWGSNGKNGIVRIWEDFGQGPFTDLVIKTGYNLISLSEGKIALTSFYPDLAVVSSKNKILWQKSADLHSFNKLDSTHFRINKTGNIIGFTPDDQSPWTFDLSTRRLIPEQSLFPSYTNNNNITPVTLNTFFPVINQIRVDFVIDNDDNATGFDITSDGNEVILGGIKYLYKTDNKAILKWKVYLPYFALGGVNISGNDKTVACILADGTFRWYSMETGKELLALYLHPDKKRWVLFTPLGYYDASLGAEDFLGWHLNNGPDKTPSFYPVSRFKEKYYRPDIIDAIFETYNEEEAITLANSRSIKKIISSAISIREKLPPTVIINSPSNGSNISSNTVSIRYTINSPEDAPAKNLRVLIDGRPVATERGLKPKVSEEQKITVTVPSKDCIITLLADNDNGTSPETNLYLKWTAPVATKEEFVYKPKLYALVIGVSDYNNPYFKLGLAAKDAGDFATTIATQKGLLYSDVIVKKLINKEATKDAITDGLDWIQKQTSQKDIAMIYYAGHGINDNNGVFYMVPVAADLERIRTTCLNFEELKQTVSSIAGKVVVFIDACHSGNVMGSTRRGGIDINAIVNELSSTENGAITFTSSTGKEFSLEDQAWGNGAFTKAVIEGLNGKAAINGKNKITIKSLDAYISERVKELTKGKQHPTSVSPPNVPDFPIAVTQ